MAQMASSSSRKRMGIVEGLPSDCWELVISKLMNKIDDMEEERNHYLETLTMVSKQVLSVTNNFVYSIKLINNPSSLPISRFFHRFPNLTSLDLSAYHSRTDINTLLSRIPLLLFPASHPSISPTTPPSLHQDSFPFLQHLDLSFPGGRIGISVDEDYKNAMNLLAKKVKLLRSVNLSGNIYINDSSFLRLCINSKFLQEVLISRCPFITHVGIAQAIRHRPNLNSFSVGNFKEGLQLENIHSYFVDSLTCLNRLTCFDFSFSSIPDRMLKALALQSPPLTKLVLNDCYNYTYSGISTLLSKCPSLQHLDLQCSRFLNDQLFTQLCTYLGDLVSINVSGCHKLTNSSFFALLTNCPLLKEIRMESTEIGIGSTPSVEDLVVYPRVKSLHLAHNSHLQDKHINIFGFMFPNMQLIDLSFCSHIYEQRIATLLKTCRKIRHLKFACFTQAKLSPIKFEACDLEVLNMSHSRIDDEELYRISKSCPRLLQLDLDHCHDVTEKGVRLAVENCTRLKEINLQHCHKVSTDIVSWMIFSRPSLRKITAPPHFRPRDCDRKLLFEQCLVL